MEMSQQTEGTQKRSKVTKGKKQGGKKGAKNQGQRKGQHKNQQQQHNRPSSHSRARSITPHQKRAGDNISTFAFSSFQNSPDPSQIPLPSFVLDDAAAQGNNGFDAGPGTMLPTGNSQIHQTEWNHASGQQLPPEDIAAMSEELKRMIGLNINKHS